MNAIVLPIPATWRQIEPPKSKYSVGDLELDVSAIQGLPEDPNEWIRVELVRRGATDPAPPIHVTTVTGWPLWIAEATIGSSGLLVAMYRFLELAAVATLSGPHDAFGAHLDEVKLVLVQAKVHWGNPPVTLAALLGGFSPPEPAR